MSNKSKAKRIMKELEQADRIVLMSVLAEVFQRIPEVIVDVYCALYLNQEDSEPDSEPDTTLDDELIELIRAGRKVAAIKLCHDRMGSPLLSARDYVHALRDDLEEDAP